MLHRGVYIEWIRMVWSRSAVCDLCVDGAG